MPRRFSAFLCVFLLSVAFEPSPLRSSGLLSGPSVYAQESNSASADEFRQQLKQKQDELQSVEKNISLKKAAVDVTQERIGELDKMLADAKARLAADEAALKSLTNGTAALTAEIERLSANVAQHEAADRLAQAASEAEGRLAALINARKELDSKLSGLRKSAVEWQSKAVESEQKIQALEGQRAGFQKEIADAKTASDAAEQQLAAAATALTAAIQARDTIMQQLATEEGRLVAASSAMSRLSASVEALKKSLSDLEEAAKALGVNSDEASNSVKSSIAELQPLLENAQSLVQQTTSRRDAIKPMVEAAVAEATKKQTERDGLADAAGKAADKHKQALAKVTDLDQQQAVLRTTVAEAQVWQKALNGQMVGTEPSVQKLAAEIQLVRSEAVAQRKLAESALEPLGRFVSFSRHVAPILSKHCVACHNTRSPGGRLNLDSFAALQKGGESGASFHAMRSSESLMVLMVEGGSMPKDAAPLSPEEISVLRRWVDVGAPLDAGVVATAELFDVMPESSQPLPPESYRVPIPVTASAFSPDGTLLATSGYHEVLIWSSADGGLVRRITNVAERVYDVEFTHDGNSLIVAAGTPGQLGEVKKFTVADGSLAQTLLRAKDSVFALSLSPDGTRVATAGADRAIHVVSVADGSPVVKIEDHADWVMDINWSPDGTRLVSSSRDKTSKVFNAVTGDPQITFPGHAEPVYSAVFLSDSKTVASGGSDKRIRIWNTADAKEIRGIGGFGSDVFRIVVLPGDNLLSACADRNAREHKSADGSLVRTLSGHADWVYTLAVNAAKNLIATGSYDGEIRLWNAADGSMATSFIGIPKEPVNQNVTVK